MAIDYSNQLL